MNIKQQKVVADELLDAFYPVDPIAVIAGGAPRDWYLGNTAQDLDLYIFISRKLQERLERKVLEKVGVTGVKRLGKLEFSHYTSNPHLRRVWEGNYMNMPVNIIILDSPMSGIVQTFPFDLCQAWYSRGEVKGTANFYRDVSENTLTLTNPTYKDGDAYVEKIKRKFKDRRFIDRR